MKKLATICAFISAIAMCANSAEIALFNGKDLKGWNFFLGDSSVDAKNVFFVKDSVVNILGKPFGYMYSEALYDNFKLSFEWRYPKKPSNSGVFVFVQDEHKLWPNAVEIQLCAGKAGDFVLLGGSDLAEFKCQGERPKFPVVKRFVNDIENETGNWNRAEIICKNGKIEVFINSIKVNEGSKPMFKKGRIAFQSEGDLIQFRNIILSK